MAPTPGHPVGGLASVRSPESPAGRSAYEPPGVAAPGMPTITVFVDRCAGCQECVVRCPTGALSMDHDRWVARADDGLCVGCRQCVRTCPFAAIAVDGPLVVAPRATLAPDHPVDLHGNIEEIRPTFSSRRAAVSEAERCLRCPDPTCMRGCPAHNDIPGFIDGLRTGNLAAAHAALRLTSVLPDVCARVCDHAAQCEGACTWALAGGQPVAIGALERYICDSSPVPPVTPTSREGRGLSVAVVGSGPAGIAVAWELAEASAAVTVYEADDRPLGVLSWGIPDFTLPQRVIDRPWEQLRAAGVEIQLGSPVYPEDLDGLLEDYDAVALCLGAGHPLGLPVPGGDLAGVEEAASFLKRAKVALATGEPLPELAAVPDEGGGAHGRRTVLVLGAGDTAMDVCRTAVRLGARVVCLSRRDRAHTRVRPDELAEAAAEGVEMRFATTISQLAGHDGRVHVAYLAPTRQRRGGAPPQVLADRAVPQPVDLVVAATGYVVDPAFVATIPGTARRRKAPKVVERRWTGSGIFTVDGPHPRKLTGVPDTRRSAVGRSALQREIDLAAARLAFKPRVWVAGDALTGPATVVEAMAQGRQAARAIIGERPRRAGQDPLGGPRRVLVAYESETGTTKRAGTVLAGRMGACGAEVRAMHLRDVSITDLGWADLLLIGTWVSGLVVARVRPARGATAVLRRLPHLAGKKVALYCTYAVNPGTTLTIMRRHFEAAGAQVIGEAALPRRKVHAASQRFGTELASRLWPAVSAAAVAGQATLLADGDRRGAAHELVWFSGGRREALQAARRLLDGPRGGDPEIRTTNSAAALLDEATDLTRREPTVDPGSTYSPLRALKQERRTLAVLPAPDERS